jgi:hypothetical protein
MFEKGNKLGKGTPKGFYKSFNRNDEGKPSSCGEYGFGLS